MAQHPLVPPTGTGAQRPPLLPSHTSTSRRMDNHAKSVDVAVVCHQELLEVPVMKKVQFLSQDHLLLETSHRSISLLSKRSASQSIFLNPTTSLPINSSPLSFTSEEVVHTSYSPDGKKSAVFRSNKKKDGLDKSKERTVEFWSVVEGRKLEEIEVGEDHGDWYFDDTFGPPTWHPSSLALLYVAEENRPTSTPSKFTFTTPDWGELFTNKKSPAIFLLVLSTSPALLPLSPPSPSPSPSPSIKPKPQLHQLTSYSQYPSQSFGQPVFIPSIADPSNPEEKPPTFRIIATGYSTLGDGKRLGIVYCANRPAGIYELGIEQVGATPKQVLTKDETEEKTKLPSTTKVYKATSATLQSPEDKSCRSPRVFLPPTGSKISPLLLFLSNPLAGPHSSCASLHAVHLLSGATTILVNSVDKPTSLDSFPGIYTDQLPQKPFVIVDGIPKVVFTSIWRSRKVVLSISLRDGKVEGLSEWPEGDKDDLVLPFVKLVEKEKEGLMSFSVLGTDGGKRVLALRSGLKGPAELVLLDLGEKDRKWKALKKPSLSEKVTEALKKIDWTVLPLPKFEPSEIMLISPIKIDPAAPASPTLPPLITIPHGGPHSTYTTDFSAQFVALAIAGYRVALVNYPGSLGFGQSFVDSLPPLLGQIDVDATLAASHYLNALSLASRTKGSRFYMGGSHGGFIGTSLSGKYPEEYDAVVLRNPVTDLASMFWSTDIPDWCYAETATPYSFTTPPSQMTPEIFSHLHSISPLTHASKVIVPTLLMVGEGDRRVPPDQSRAWYHALKGNGNNVEVEMLRFPGNGHALDSTVETELVGFEQGLRWLAKFTVL